MDDVSNGEIYRRLCDMDERYEARLARIEDQVRTTNGRTTTLEVKVSVVESILRALRHRKTDGDVGESFSIKFSPKLWTALAAGLGILFAMVVEWVKDRIAKP
jgi:hypothetical protein